MTQIKATFENGTISGVSWSLNTAKVDFTVEGGIATVDNVYLDDPDLLEDAIYEVLEIEYIDNVVLFDSAEDVERDTVLFGTYMDDVKPAGVGAGSTPKNIRPDSEDQDGQWEPDTGETPEELETADEASVQEASDNSDPSTGSGGG